jgi:hypothetical protein
VRDSVLKALSRSAAVRSLLSRVRQLLVFVVPRQRNQRGRNPVELPARLPLDLSVQPAALHCMQRLTILLEERMW